MATENKVPQWVNLKKEARFVGDKIESEERLEHLHFECEFKNAKPAGFKVRIVPVGNQANYLKEEKNRNPNFRMRVIAPHNNHAQKKVKVEASAYLPAAGGNRYKVEAKYRDKVVESKKEIETWRRLYYQVISMKGVPVPQSLNSFQEDFKNEKDKFYIELIEKDNGRDKMKLIRTVASLYTGGDPQSISLNGQEFRDEARKVYTLGRYHPYAVAVVFSNYIGTKEKFSLRVYIDKAAPKDNYKIGPNQINVAVRDRDDSDHYPWHNLDRDDSVSDNKDWLIPNSATFVTDDGSAIPIPHTDISVVGTKAAAEGGYSVLNVRFRTPELRAEFQRLKGTLKIDLYVVRGFSGGFSYTGLNLITVATKAWWNPSSEKKMLQILNHEMGHKIGMVAYGEKGNEPKYKNNPNFERNKLLPNAPSTLYGENRGMNDLGHQGPHCSYGATYNKKYKRWSNKPGCVMFGATGLQDLTTGIYTPSPKSFCPECTKIVRKLDLDGTGLKGLKGKF